LLKISRDSPPYVFPAQSLHSSTVPPKSIKLLLPAISPAAPGTLYEQIVSGLKRVISERRIEPAAESASTSPPLSTP
jgi:hypothetical protein